jgi:hypothetical protein
MSEEAEAQVQVEEAEAEVEEQTHKSSETQKLKYFHVRLRSGPELEQVQGPASVRSSY